MDDDEIAFGYYGANHNRFVDVDAEAGAQNIPPRLLHDIDVFDVSTLSEQSIDSRDRRLGAKDCSSFVVPQCYTNVDRDVIFLIDASDSMDRAKFYTSELDLIQSVYCAFDPSVNTRAALITFSSTVTTRIPLALHTAPQWFEKVDLIRSDPAACCKCCAPLAEAFQRAKALFDNAAVVKYTPLRTVLVITDGEPYQNPGSSGWLYPKSTVSNYLLSVLPAQAFALKNQAISNPVRIMLVGIPNKNRVAPRVEFFKGIPDPLIRGGPVHPIVRQCYKRGARKSCGSMKSPLFPIVSLPLQDNVLTLDMIQGSMQQDVNSIITALCG